MATTRKPTKAEIAARIRAAGERAKIEAEARRAETTPAPEPSKQEPREIGGQAGPEPTRYGDWEKKGLISDF